MEAGEEGIDTCGIHSRFQGATAVLHGTKTGSCRSTFSRAQCIFNHVSECDKKAAEAFHHFSQLEGIISALETAYARNGKSMVTESIAPCEERTPPR